MAYLGQVIREIQRDAAALPTAALRDEIAINLKIQDAAIRQFHRIRPGAENMADREVATGTVMISALPTALYVAELATRPVDVTTVVTSVN